MCNYYYCLFYEHIYIVQIQSIPLMWDKIVNKDKNTYIHIKVGEGFFYIPPSPSGLVLVYMPHPERSIGIYTNTSQEAEKHNSSCGTNIIYEIFNLPMSKVIFKHIWIVSDFQ